MCALIPSEMPSAVQGTFCKKATDHMMNNRKLDIENRQTCLAAFCSKENLRFLRAFVKVEGNSSWASLSQWGFEVASPCSSLLRSVLFKRQKCRSCKDNNLNAKQLWVIFAAMACQENQEKNDMLAILELYNF